MCHGSNGNVVEKRHRHRPSDLLMAMQAPGVAEVKQDAKDESRIIYELLYVCGGKGWGRTPVTSCQRSNRDLNVGPLPSCLTPPSTASPPPPLPSSLLTPAVALLFHPRNFSVPFLKDLV